MTAEQCTEDKSTEMEDREETERRNPRGGRPQLLATDKRSEKLEIRLTMAEKILFREKAAASGQSVSDWLRNLGEGHRPRPPVTALDAAFITELSRIGNNVNQLARATHRGRDTGTYWRDIGQELERLLAQAAEKL